MGAFIKLAYHIVFSTKYRQPTLRREFQERLFEYLGGIVRRLNGYLIENGGVEDHVHLQVGLPPTIAVSDAVRDI